MAKRTTALRPMAAGDGKTKTLTVRLPRELTTDLDAVRAEARAAGFKLDITRAVVDAVRSHVPSSPLACARRGAGR